MKRFIQSLIVLLILPFTGKTQTLSIGSGATVYVNRNGSTTTTPILNVTGAVQNNGTVSDAGSVQMTGDFTNGGTLTVNIGGTTLGTNYDQLNITGAATFTCSTLNVTLVNGYTPISGASFTILNATTLTGTFSMLNLPTLSSGLSWNTSYNPTAGTVILSVMSALPVDLLAFKATPQYQTCIWIGQQLWSKILKIIRSNAHAMVEFLQLSEQLKQQAHIQIMYISTKNLLMVLTIIA